MPLRVAVVLAALVLAGCGGGKDDQTPKAKEKPTAEATATAAPSTRGSNVSVAEDATIRGWADALRNGEVDRAVGYWAVPAVFSNGDAPLRLQSADAVRLVNEGFPCGAKVESTRRDPNDRRYVVAVFVLTERKGGSGCGSGTGNRAETAFRIRHHKIVEWLRLADPDQGGGEEAASS